jgi:hypothetical protein
MPHLPITLYGDHTPPPGLFDDFVRVEGAMVFREKLRCLAQSPYDQTLFLDSDTFVVADVSELFDLLDRFHLAATHDRSYVDWFPPEAGVPAPFREFNTGVIVYRKSDEIGRFFNDCLAWYDKLSALPAPTPRFLGQFPDQPAFRAAAYHGDLRAAMLTFEYNCRFPYFGSASGEIKILHGREFLSGFHPGELERAAAGLNRTKAPRVFIAGRVWALAKTTSPYSRRIARGSQRYLPPHWLWLVRRAWARLGSRPGGRAGVP